MPGWLDVLYIVSLETGKEENMKKENDINGLWMHRLKVNPFQNIDAFHCFDCDGEEACLYCPHCGVAERYELMGRIHQHYKSGFAVWKDWNDVKEVYDER